MNAPVLLVDDDRNLLAGLARNLGRRYNLSLALDGEAALNELEAKGPFAVVVCDMRMPGRSGVEVLEEISRRAPDTVRIMLTGNADQQTAIDAVNRGSIFRFFVKPCMIETLAEGIDAGLRLYRLVTAERELLEKTLAGSVKMLVDLLSLVDPSAFQQTAKLREWSRQVAKAMGVNEIWMIDMAALLAGIGLVAVPPEVLARRAKGEALSDAEREMIVKAPETARALLANIPRMEAVAEAVYYQYKDFDGGGFPADVMAGEAIPFAARLLRVLVALHETGYGVPSREAFRQLEKAKGRFDPRILGAAKATLGGVAAVDGSGLVRLDLPVSAVHTGDILESNLELTSGRLVLAAGSEISEAIRARLRNLLQAHEFKEPVTVNRRIAAPRGAELPT